MVLFAAEFPGMKLPSYKDATTLPSYDEAQQSKAAEAALMKERDEESNSNFTDVAIGTDGMFLCTFICKYQTGHLLDLYV